MLNKGQISQLQRDLRTYSVCGEKDCFECELQGLAADAIDQLRSFSCRLERENAELRKALSDAEDSLRHFYDEPTKGIKLGDIRYRIRAALAALAADPKPV